VPASISTVTDGTMTEHMTLLVVRTQAARH